MTGITLPRRLMTPLHVIRHLRHRGDVHHLDDLAHLQHRQAVLLVARARTSGTCPPRRVSRRRSSSALRVAIASMPSSYVPLRGLLPRAPSRVHRSRCPCASRISPMRPSPRMAPPAMPRTLANVSPSDLIDDFLLAEQLVDDERRRGGPSSSMHHDGALASDPSRAPAIAEQVAEPQQRHAAVAHLNHAAARPARVCTCARQRPQRLADRERRDDEALARRRHAAGRRESPASAAA